MLTYAIMNIISNELLNELHYPATYLLVIITYNIIIAYNNKFTFLCAEDFLATLITPATSEANIAYMMAGSGQADTSGLAPLRSNKSIMSLMLCPMSL